MGAPTWPPIPPNARSARRSRALLDYPDLLRLADHAFDQPVHLAKVGEREMLTGLHALDALVVLERSGEYLRLARDELGFLRVHELRRVGGHGRAERRQREEVVGEGPQDVLALERAGHHVLREPRVEVAPRERHA